MLYKGLVLKRNKSIGVRDSKDGDAYVDGRTIEKNHLVFVHAKDCKLIDKDGNEYKSIKDNPEIEKKYDVFSATKIIELDGHSRTNMAYGKIEEKTSKNGVFVFDIDTKQKVYVHAYMQQKIYVCIKGKIYTCTKKWISNKKKEGDVEKTNDR